VALLVLWAVTGNHQDNAPGSATDTKEQTLPAAEAEFVSTIASFKASYEAASNEFQKSTVRRERSAALARSLRDRSVDGWIGTVSSMQTTGDGNGILSIKPPGYGWITINTWNNSLSDIGSGTLIPAGSPLYEQVSHLSVGEKIIFAGTFGSSGLDYLKESSLTEAGAMDEPEFIFRFADVRPANSSQQTARVLAPQASIPETSNARPAPPKAVSVPFFLGFTGGESVSDAANHAAALGFMRAGNCTSRQDAPEYTDCKFAANDGESMEVSFYGLQLQGMVYRFGASRYEDVLGEITKLHGTARTLHDAYNPSYEVSKEWGSPKERFSISLGKTADGGSAFAIVSCQDY
jgi:hypothetical protein